MPALGQLYNYLEPTQFMLTMDRARLPNVQFTVQNVTLPDLSVSSAPIGSPRQSVPLPGDKIDWGQMDVQFIIDEKLRNYYEIYRWLLDMAESPEPDGYKLGSRNQRDLTLHIIDSKNERPDNRIVFHSAFPTSLSSIPFDITVTDIEYMIAVAAFSFSDFAIELSE